MEKQMKVVHSTNDNIPVGTTLTVENHKTNEYTGVERVTVSAEPQLDHRITSFQMFKSGENWWTEIVVGRESDEIRVE